MVKSIDGVVISSLDYGEHDKLITLLTAEEGRIQAIAKGAKSMRSKQLNCTQPFVYGMAGAVGRPAAPGGVVTAPA